MKKTFPSEDSFDDGPYLPKLRLLHGCLGGCLYLAGAVLILYLITTAVALITIEVNYRKWVGNGLTDYSVTVKFGTFSGYYYNTMQEFVKSGKVTSPVTFDSQPTINRLFEAARSCAVLPIPFLSCEIDYDPRYGYPSQLKQQDFDMGDVTEISDLIPGANSAP